MIFAFQANLNPVPPGVIPAFLVCAENIQNAYAIAKTNVMGTPGVPYKPSRVVDSGNYLIGNLFPHVPLSRQHIQGGQPVGGPAVQPGGPQEPRGFHGFEGLGPDAVAKSNDNLFGEFEDGTYADLYNGGGATEREIPRPKITNGTL